MTEKRTAGEGAEKALVKRGRAVVAEMALVERGRAVVAKVERVRGEMARVTEEVAAGMREREFRQGAQRVLEDALAAAVSMPEFAKAKLRRQLAVKAGEAERYGSVDAYEEVVAAAFEADVETMEAVMGSEWGSGGRGIVRGCGVVRVVEESERQGLVAQLAMDRLFGVEGGTGHDDVEWRRAREIGLVSGIPRWSGIREAYVRLTGDAVMSGVLNPEGSIVREANEVTSGVLSNALVNSMHKRLVRDYRRQPQTWRKFCTVTPLQDFKAQHRVRLYDFASLSVVPEGAAYTNQAWGDAKEVYTPQKRGNLVTVTREAILNDDLRSIARIPERLGRAAYVTMSEFVYGLFTSNPTMNDNKKVFDDGVQTSHANRGTAALSAAAVQAAITTMAKQTNTTGKRLSLQPKYLLAPPELYFAARVLVESERAPGSGNNDANVLRGGLEPISVPHFTDGTDWYLVCEPDMSETIEIGFVRGREEPELLVQDLPRYGQVFTNDQIAFKVRWEFGGGWVDYRGAYWSQVNG